MNTIELRGLMSLLASLKTEAETAHAWLVASQITEVSRWVERRAEEKT